MTVTLTQTSAAVPAPRSGDPLSRLRQLPDEVVAVALVMSDMPAIAPTRSDDWLGREHTVDGLEGALADWFDQGVARLGGLAHAFLAAFRARQVRHALSMHPCEATRLEHETVLGSEERSDQAMSLAFAITVLDDEGNTHTSLPDELDIVHSTLFMAIVDEPASNIAGWLGRCQLCTF